MSFLKITDPAKRDFIVNEFLKTKRSIQESSQADKPIWESKIRKGKGIVILPSDPNALVEMLSLQMAGSKVGNTGAANEAVAICDELLRQGVTIRIKQ